ncbi:MAG: pyrroline-5-carboxylate reductase [Proteobacteria bacterium]|nr:pyrroline-5-carboxylate reductase [Pseudomonadota bacterium]
MSDALLLVGSGRMGSALLTGWLEQGTEAGNIFVVEPGKPARQTANKLGVHAVAELAALPIDLVPRVIVFAIKPQAMDDIVPAYGGFNSEATFFLSIAAGKPAAYFERALGDGAAVVRAMPNTPAAVGRGMTVMFANSRVNDDAKAIAEHLLGAVGETAWADDEGLMDAVTAVSGSGPAYVFYLIECLAAAGIKAGLPAELAMRLARATVCGAGELAYRDPTPAADLRRNVTSPGGTTEAALEVLMNDAGLEALMGRAVGAAAKRSRDLAH